MPTTLNGDIALHFETFGADTDPVLLLVNGLGSQCINFKIELCELFAARGFRVVRFDNRDVGLSSHLEGGPRYTLSTWPATASPSSMPSAQAKRTLRAGRWEG